ncbi:hypothetical protein PHYBOEH_010370 [Phytophthora boehmeriae]|uniref:SCP domain-containing protein n=1 Tax=Phytophthora boehmeriae TaxID=109152 RepID=A0A8T1VPB2_9STRA|nr:hypothetical protein PHYBOEH_010370 [Phytophthora boehmeriae]
MVFAPRTLALLAVLATASTEAANLRQRNLQTYSTAEEYTTSMLDRVNQERAKAGLSPLCTNKKLQDAAQQHSDDQAANNYMGHDGTDGTSVSDRITQAGYDWNAVAENVAAGQEDVDGVMESWMNSPGHRENILGDYTMFGTAYAYNPNSEFKHYWTQDFGSGDAEECGGDSVEAAAPTTNTVKRVVAYATPETEAPVVTYAGDAATPCPESGAIPTDTYEAATPYLETEAPSTDAYGSATPYLVTDAPATGSYVTETPCPETDAPSSDASEAYPATDAPAYVAETPYPVTDAPAGSYAAETPCPETYAPSSDASEAYPVTDSPAYVAETPYPVTDAPAGSYAAETPCPETYAPSSDASQAYPVTDAPATGSYVAETPCPVTDVPSYDASPVTDAPVEGSYETATPCPTTDAPVTDAYEAETPCPETDAPVVIDSPEIGTSPENAYGAGNAPVSPEAEYATGKDCEPGF